MTVVQHVPCNIMAKVSARARLLESFCNGTRHVNDAMSRDVTSLSWSVPSDNTWTDSVDGWSSSWINGVLTNIRADINGFAAYATNVKKIRRLV